MRFSLVAFFVVAALACGRETTMQNSNKPVAAFKLTQSTVRPQVVAFDAADSHPTVGFIAKYKWKFGDEGATDTPTELTAATAQHAYKMTGMFTVTLVVADDKGTESDAVTKTVNVTSIDTSGPMAKISGPMTGQPAAMLTFDGTSSTPAADLQNYAWDFGDGQHSAGKDKQIVQHAFATAAVFRVTLTVTDSLGQSNTAELQVTVGDAGPLAVCSWSPATVSVGTQVMFAGAQSTAPAGSMLQAWVWDFGDGTNNVPGNTQMGGAAAHAYQAMGTFHPKLKVYDNHSPTPRTNETTCPDVVVGAAALCSGPYQWTLTNGGLCTASATTVSLAQMANGTMTLTEPGGPMGDILYTGTWTGSTFQVMGSYSDGILDYDVIIDGTFTNGCTNWTGTYHTTSSGQPVCAPHITATAL
jgi:PKD repeat protein